MTLAFRSAAVIATVLLLGACSPSPSGSGTPAASVAAPSSAASAPAASSGAPSQAAAAGEPCSFLTAEAVGAILGTTPVEVAERIGRGDCDYWLTAAKDTKVSIGVFTGAEATSYFEGTKNIGTPQDVNVGDDAYAIVNEGLGTIIVAKKGDSVAIVQVLAGLPADQMRQATAIVEAVLAGL